MVKSGDGSTIVRWLVSEGARCQSPAELLADYCARLREHGIAVDRSTLGAPLLHPIAQSSYVFWSVETGASLRWFQWNDATLETMRASPIYPIYQSGEPASLNLADEDDRHRFPIGEDLWQEGFVRYEALPLRFSDRSFKALTLASRSGFSKIDMALIQETLPALALVFEGFLAQNTARTLMETYVGKRAGLRVLDGEISRGEGNFIDAVILFADLRGFTQLSDSHSAEDLLRLLNDYFGLLTDSIEENGGEVLKFIGDAMLAIFEHDNEVEDAVVRAETAAFAAIAGHAEKFATKFSFGIGMHPGRVFYGNIGGGTRLDFTVIGAAVNIASRIESLCHSNDEPLLVSQEFARHSRNGWISLGTFQLKGVAEPVEIFRPGEKAMARVK